MKLELLISLIVINVILGCPHQQLKYGYEGAAWCSGGKKSECYHQCLTNCGGRYKGGDCYESSQQGMAAYQCWCS